LAFKTQNEPFLLIGRFAEQPSVFFEEWPGVGNFHNQAFLNGLAMVISEKPRC
jgi:hypothetical protein